MTILVYFVVTNTLFFNCIRENYDKVTSLFCYTDLIIKRHKCQLYMTCKLYSSRTCTKRKTLISVAHKSKCHLSSRQTISVGTTRVKLRNTIKLQNIRFRGCLHDTGATFAPEQVHSGSLSWLYICLHDTTTKCYAGASHPGVSSPRFSHRGENFTPVRNLTTVSCKRETTTHFGVKSVCR